MRRNACLSESDTAVRDSGAAPAAWGSPGDVRIGPTRGDRRQRPAPLELSLAMPLVERALQVLERRAVQPQLGLLKSTMLQLDSAFNERAYGASGFSDFIEKLKRADLVQVSGTGGRYIIERKGSAQPEQPALKPEELLPPLRDVLENHRLEIENGCPVEDLSRPGSRPSSPTSTSALTAFRSSRVSELRAG